MMEERCSKCGRSNVGLMRKFGEFEERKRDNTSVVNSSSLYISNQRQNKGGSCLLLIDPQYDFVHGSLAVPGAVEDCARIAQFIRENLNNLQDIYVTLDTHMSYHIAHPIFWVNAKGEHPPVFTQITYEDVETGLWTPKDKQLRNWALHYTKTLQKPRLKGMAAFTLTIWPPHCLLGTPGHSVEATVLAALQEWELANDTCVHYILKGNNSKTEHYSAFRAEVEVENDSRTTYNNLLYDNLMKHSSIFVAGEAKSHCVNFTVRDLVEKMTPEKAVRKVVLLEDGMCSVPGCDSDGDKFMADMKNVIAEGVGLVTRSIATDRVRALGPGLVHVPTEQSKRKAKA